MSISVNCSQSWDTIKSDKIHIDHKWPSGWPGILEKQGIKAAGVDTDDKGLIFDLNEDIKQICPDSDSTLKKFSKIFGSFEDIACMGIDSFIDNKKLDTYMSNKLVKAIKTQIRKKCPQLISSCTQTVCNDAKKQFLVLKCDDIKDILLKIIKDSTVQQNLEVIINQNLNIKIDLTKINPCNLIQLLYSLGINFSGLFLKLLNDKLKTYGLNLTPELINCVCPDINNTKDIDCTNVNIIFNTLLDNKDFQNLIKTKLNIDITQKKCDILQNLINTGVDPSKVIINLIKDSKYPITQEKINQVIKCICPKLTSHPSKPVNNGNDNANDNDNRNQDKVTTTFYNKFNIIILILLMFLLIIIVFIISKKLKVGIPFLNLLLIVIIFSYIGFLLVQTNPKCLFKSCISSGDDWKYIPGLFKGEKSMFGITLSSQIEIGDDNVITVKELNCSGKICPPGNLLDHCGNNKAITIDKTKSNFGYAIHGDCIDKIYKIKQNGTQIVTGLWVTQHNTNINLNVQLNIPLLGLMMLTIPAEKIK